MWRQSSSNRNEVDTPKGGSYRHVQTSAGLNVSAGETATTGTHGAHLEPPTLTLQLAMGHHIPATCDLHSVLGFQVITPTRHDQKNPNIPKMSDVFILLPHLVVLTKAPSNPSL